jgi:hypothetical protein
VRKVVIAVAAVLTAIVFVDAIAYGLDARSDVRQSRATAASAEAAKVKAEGEAKTAKAQKATAERRA